MHLSGDKPGDVGVMSQSMEYIRHGEDMTTCLAVSGSLQTAQGVKVVRYGLRRGLVRESGR